ncbi:MAG: ParA family protein, partial [Pseudomonadota bacterium]
TGLGIGADQREVTTFDLLSGERSLRDVAKATAVPRLHVAPSTLDLLGIETELASAQDRAYRLKTAIAAHHGRGPRFDYILVDCPPSLNLLTLNALAAADSVLVPLQTEFFALEGLTQLLSTIEQVRGSLNKQLELQGIVLTMVDSRNRLTRQVEEDVRETMGDAVYKTVIPRNVRISEAPSFGKPVLLYDMNCTGSQAYLQLAAEVIKREKNTLAAQAA